MTEMSKMREQANEYRMSMLSGTFHKRNPITNKIIGSDRTIVNSVIYILTTAIYQDRSGEIKSLQPTSMKNLANRLHIEPSEASNLLDIMTLAGETEAPNEDKIPDWILAQVKSIQSQYIEERRTQE